MSKIVLVTGGARSGKSTFAENEVRKLNKKTAYIATAIAFDDAMKSRIKKHIEQRPSIWTTYEKPTQVHEVIDEVRKSNEVVLLDCITVLITNTMFQDRLDFDRLTEEEVDAVEKKITDDLKLLVAELEKTDLTVYMVTNEVGSGIVPENRLARIFRDFAGRANQYLASLADEVYMTVSGIPVKIKG
ncbi:bifunctional adenosylcobinamide kinase/adenosylcobinamide-phosphate guanylyltransferase [Acidaminobacter sp. JC074]|uniref:bifunctional adenosylcobinamide kinase/adenosylcobinamide-phosphate guanylyltransferase n=1 Tax=Acidaminobacter sp. JC074 TaxID=2530199 RepID=UPI001F0D5F12|nr:bifunctional adenosylcobinamide kinase/adenosylcobinamide-phosphate guanylyltransferase [Acidaminobacter sp. JC074]MCH4889165.1 bifunctional adenosylcobinamide kinase/adenosylcobinamide-phosphate guanylyltransferase [Acidaminobacter sp. JC074]